MIQKVKLITREGKKVMGYRVTVTSDFHSNIENIWDKIQDIDTLREICKPKASFIACDDSPIQWKGRHTINVVKMDKTSREIDTKEYDNTVVIWNHYIKMEEISQQVTRYTDTVDLYAGCLTSIAAWWTLKFYKHRQRKWQKIAKSL